jgi:hypothetical protein
MCSPKNLQGEGSGVLVRGRFSRFFELFDIERLKTKKERKDVILNLENDTNQSR